MVQSVLISYVNTMTIYGKVIGPDCWEYFPLPYIRHSADTDAAHMGE